VTLEIQSGGVVGRRLREQDVGAGARLERPRGLREVDPGRDQHESRGHRDAPLEAGDRERGGQPAAGGVTARKHRAAVGADRVVHRDRVAQRGRVRVLRREWVVDEHDLRARYRRDAAAECAPSARGAQAVATPVEVHERAGRRRRHAHHTRHARDLGLVGRDAVGDDLLVVGPAHERAALDEIGRGLAAGAFLGQRPRHWRYLPPLMRISP
jgi:hypothetical protein